MGGYSLGDILLVTRNETLKYDPATYGDIYTWVKTFEDGYVKPLDDYSTHHMLNGTPFSTQTTSPCLSF